MITESTDDQAVIEEKEGLGPYNDIVCMVFHVSPKVELAGGGRWRLPFAVLTVSDAR